MKIEIFDQNGKLIDTVSGSTHRGLNRANWGMRIKPPEVAPAATALQGASRSPKILP